VTRHSRPETETHAELPCRSNPDVFFENSDPISVIEAKTLCRACPVATACLTGALERRESWGVWGGALFEGGQVIPFKRPPGRPQRLAIANSRTPGQYAGSVA